MSTPEGSQDIGSEKIWSVESAINILMDSLCENPGCHFCPGKKEIIKRLDMMATGLMELVTDNLLAGTYQIGKKKK